MRDRERNEYEGGMRREKRWTRGRGQKEGWEKEDGEMKHRERGEDIEETGERMRNMKRNKKIMKEEGAQAEMGERG